jgi:hypothetical protein
MADQPFDQAEFMRALERVAKEDGGYGDGNPTPQFDPKEWAERAREGARGLTIDDYRRCLDGQGMRFVPAHRLGPWADGQPRKEGLWFHPNLDLMIAFTKHDILTLFQGPGDLWHWIERKKLELRASRAGLQLPPN